MLVACNRRESEKESENGRKILRTRNGQKSKKEQGKGDTISLKSTWRINEREQEKIRFSDERRRMEREAAKEIRRCTNEDEQEGEGK